MKDAKGHGSEGSGGKADYRAKVRAGLDRAEKFGVRQRALVAGGMKPMDAFTQTHKEMNGVAENHAAAATLASGPKSAPVATHPAMKVPESMDEFTHGHSSFERRIKSEKDW